MLYGIKPVRKTGDSRDCYRQISEVLFWLLLLFLVYSPLVLGAGDEGTDVWLIMDRVSVEQLLVVETPVFDYLQRQGALGLVNVRTANGISPENIYLSIGSAERALGSKHFFKKDNFFKDNIFYDQQEIHFQAVNKVKELNKDNTYSPEIGYLGNIFCSAEKKITLLGNNDTGISRNRLAVLLAMDGEGSIPLGVVDGRVLKPVDYPWGWETDLKAIKHYFNKYRRESDILLIETGDTGRLYDPELRLTAADREKYTKKYIQKIDQLLEYIIREIDLEDNNLGVIVPTPPGKQLTQGAKLSWLLMAGPDIEPGWLVSPATRRPGVVTLRSIAPTLAQRAGIDDPGREVMSSRAARVFWDDLERLNRHIITIDSLRPLFIRGFILLQLVVLFLGVLGLFCGYRLPFIMNIVFEYLLVLLMLVPLNLLFISQFLFAEKLFYLLLLLLFSVIEIWLLEKITKREMKTKRVLVIALTTVAVIVFDLVVNNSGLMADSLLGYSSVIGARFYGLGNEYMGIFVGGTLIGLSGVIDYFGNGSSTKRLRIVVLIFIFFCVIVVGGSGLGANFGGLLTMTAGGIITSFYMLGKKPGIKMVVGGIILAAATVLLVLLLNYYQILGEHTHISKLLNQLVEGEGQLLLQTVYRKVSMNLKLLRWTIWTRILLAFLSYLLFVSIYPRGKVATVKREYPCLMGGIYGGLWATLVAISVNDSGVVAGATLLFFPVLTLIYLGKES